VPDARVTYNFEYEQRLRCAFIGAGDHAYRNVYPTFQYAPVDLVAVCDLRAGRAAAYARQFGAERSYADHREMLERERPDAVFIVTRYHDDGRVQATDLALDCLRAGAHVWMEKPAAASVAEIDALQRASDESGRFVLVGLKKIFTPAIDKVAQLMASEEFGPVSSVSVRYPQALPAPERRDDLVAMQGFLDHIYHPAAILVRLLGPVQRFSYEWEPATGSSVASLRFGGGEIGSLHLAAGIAESAPLERVEVVGRDANVVIDNGVRVTYYRPGVDRGYGRTPSYLADDAVAPLLWEPEFSLGQLCNKNLFYLGYVPEVLHFCESVQAGRAPVNGTLAQARAIMELFEAYQRVPAGVVATLPLEAA
jgi:predicted dehydrogenase